MGGVGETVAERRCMVCLGESVEDEEHFLLNCPMYVRERARMFEEIRSKCKIDVEKSRVKEEIINLIIGNGVGDGELGREVRKIVMIYILKANKIRSKYVSK